MLKGMPCVHGPHGKAAEAPVISGFGDVLQIGTLRIGAVLGFHGGNEVVHQLMVEVIRQPQGQGVTAAVRFTGVVVGGQDDDERSDFPVLDGVIHDVLKGVGAVRGSHDRRLIAPAAVA